ncbi:hypothetical protein C1646_773821 [Rhizophagus diaphanus]|nr:hypothetical protein C1646_773821 [Rhizophagus diaphanus] [Rhizophagus sp. MUCL 43196]
MILDESRVEATETLRSPEKNLSNFDLKVENGKLRADNMELQYRVDKLNKELEELKELNEMLIKINEEFRKENDTLYKRIDFYKNLRMPRSMKKSSKPKHKHQRNNDSEDSDDEIFDMDVEMDERDEKDNKDEKDDKDARTILKTMPAKFDLDYDQTFMSKINIDIRKKLIPELMNSLKPNFNPTYDQLTKWLMSLYKSRRSRNNYKKKGKLDKNIYHLKAAKALYDKDDVRIAHYKKQEIINIIQDMRYHSPELSETNEETTSDKR